MGGPPEAALAVGGAVVGSTTRLVPAEATPQARVPALLVKKQGDYPPFWHKNGSFIETMEELYERVRTKSSQLK